MLALLQGGRWTHCICVPLYVVSLEKVTPGWGHFLGSSHIQQPACFWGRFGKQQGFYLEDTRRDPEVH